MKYKIRYLDYQGAEFPHSVIHSGNDSGSMKYQVDFATSWIRSGDPRALCCFSLVVPDTPDITISTPNGVVDTFGVLQDISLQIDDRPLPLDKSQWRLIMPDHVFIYPASMPPVRTCETNPTGLNPWGQWIEEDELQPAPRKAKQVKICSGIF